MPFKITLKLMRNGILKITISGRNTRQDADTITSNVIAELLKTRPSAVLFDVRKLKDRLDIADGFFRVRKLPPQLRKIKAALVDLEENKEYAEFFALTAGNAGYQIRFFTDLGQARTWLKSS